MDIVVMDYDVGQTADLGRVRLSENVQRLDEPGPSKVRDSFTNIDL
jgi:hypothetical protein